ncbi:hypothetical protein DL546_006178 [Coniochaeta pulveracea]|uniref:SET domain-containing protein n=1 Tax=Coniochaeta pulveracea TaxID=177199 RepID=A0A420YEU0_9PEZI|nr:hypothetical protein DL546_006178 [Coniochaeta pulveracea]
MTQAEIMFAVRANVLAVLVAVQSLVGAVELCSTDGSSSGQHAFSCSQGVIENIDITHQASNNFTTLSSTPGLFGWYDPKICSGDYCVFANRDIANGRGMSVISTTHNLQKIRRTQNRLYEQDINKSAQDPPPYEVKNLKGKGLRLVANRTIKRGEHLMAWSPVLLVRKTFFDDVPAEEQNHLLAAAFKLLPEKTQKQFQGQLFVANAGSSRALKDIVLRHSFETDLGWAAQGRDEYHYASYPEVTVFHHDCRPNVAFYIDGAHIHRTNVARKIQPGEELTITYINNPLQSRRERQKMVKKWTGSECSCSLCSAHKDVIKASEDRLKEIRRLQAKLADHESTGVTKAMIDRYIKLYKEERLETRLADAYELVATNYNYLGFSKEAKKYAMLSAQAGAIEGGREANNVIAMNILAKDPEGHYSYRMKAKKGTL